MGSAIVRREWKGVLMGFFYFLFVAVGILLYLSFRIHRSFFPESPLMPFVIGAVLMMLALTLSMIWVGTWTPWLQRIGKIIIYFSTISFLYMAAIFILWDILNFFINVSYKHQGIITLWLTVFLIILGYLNTRFIREKTYTLESDKISRDIKIVLLSDFHIGSLDMTKQKMKTLIRKVNRQKPDLILIPGDVLDYASVNIEKLGYSPLFQEFHSQYGTFISLGNHEHYFGSVENVEKRFNRIPHTKVLDNTLYPIPDLNLDLIGLSDKGRKEQRTKNPSYFPLKKETFNIVLEHNPINFRQNIHSPIDLQVSGHTHAGQVFLGHLVELLLYEKPWGLLKKGSSTLITTSGVGSWGPPVRDTSYPEMVLIHLKKVSKS